MTTGPVRGPERSTMWPSGESAPEAPDPGLRDVELGDINDLSDAPLRDAKAKAGGPPLETEYRPVDWKKLLLSPKYIPFHILGVILIVITILVTVYHDKVVDTLRPWSEKVRDLPAGWLIPIGILVIISFPPLFGHEIVALLCGLVYGLWIGFAIVAAGTFLGEIGTWFAFKYAFRRKAEKLERTNLNYGALARLTRDGGFWVVLIIRFSAIPSHFSTAVFSTCNVNFWFFAIATFLTLPKQLVLVYLGVLLIQTKDATGSKDDTIKDIMFAATGVLTVVLGGWILLRMQKTKKALLEEQAQRRADREMRQVKEAETARLMAPTEAEAAAEAADYPLRAHGDAELVAAAAQPRRHHYAPELDESYPSASPHPYGQQAHDAYDRETRHGYAPPAYVGPRRNYARSEPQEDDYSQQPPDYHQWV